MAGYTRQDLANNISNGNVIDADDLDNEFNAIDAAFNNSTGHTHDGTAENGSPITVVGPVQDIVVTTTLMRPKTTNVVSLGTDALRYKDLYLEGNADVDGTINVQGATTLQNTLDVTSNVTVGGNITVDGNAVIAGNTTLGDAATDTVIFTADVSSNILPSADDTYDLGATGAEWRNLYIDGTANIDTADIDTSNVTTANVGTLAVSGNATVAGSLTVTGTINASVTGVSSEATKLATARTIALAGDVSGAANFDGSSNITITTVIADDSHNHTIANVDGLQDALDAKASTLGDLGVTATATELNYVNGVTSAIQTQLDTKLSSTHTGDVDITGTLVVDSYNETFTTITSASNAATLDCEVANVFSLTLSEDITTFTWSNPPTSGTAYVFALKVIQDAGGNQYTIDWPASVNWPEGIAPSLSSGASEVDQFVFYTHDGGTIWYGFVSGKNLG